MNRRELRDRSVLMSFGQRAALMSGSTRDKDFVDAVLEQAAWVSGFDIYNPNELDLYEAAKAERLRDLHGQLIDQIEERDAVEREARMILDVARDDLKLHSEMEDHAFSDFAKVIESKVGAPWILRQKKPDGSEQVTVCEVKNGKAEYHPASEDEARDGREFPDMASYLASRAA